MSCASETSYNKENLYQQQKDLHLDVYDSM